MEFFLVTLLNSLSYGLLLFMLSSGLTLIFSMMGVLNFAHASFYMLGAYFAIRPGCTSGSGRRCSLRPCWWARSARSPSVTGCARCTSLATSPNYCSPSALPT